MRILYFNYLYDTRGASLGSAIKPIELFRALQERGHAVRLCWLKDETSGSTGQGGRQGLPFRQALKRRFARFVHDPKLLAENLVFARREERQVRDFQPDLIVARHDLYVESFLHTARKYALPLVVEADSPPLYEAMAFQKQYWRIAALPRAIERKVLSSADLVIAQSRELQDYFIREHGLEPSRTAMVTNGADPVLFQPQKRSADLMGQFGLHQGPVLGFVGSMNVWHGLDNLVQIMRAILERHANAQFLLVGAGGGAEEHIRRFAAESGFTDRVVFTGYIPYEQIPQIVQLMDIVLAPYPDLPFFYYSPVKLFEYMAAGKPVVTTAIGQIEQVVRNNQTGLLCPAGRFDCIVQALEELLHNSNLRKRLGENARREIETRHTWQHKAAEWESLCRQLLNRPGKQADSVQ